MAKIVMKFGGTSVADLDRIRHVAQLVKTRMESGDSVAVVVSAMAGETDKLVRWARDLSALHDAREYDVVVAAGEQITAGLLAIATHLYNSSGIPRPSTLRFVNPATLRWVRQGVLLDGSFRTALWPTPQTILALTAAFCCTPDLTLAKTGTATVAPPAFPRRRAVAA